MEPLKQITNDVNTSETLGMNLLVNSKFFSSYLDNPSKNPYFKVEESKKRAREEAKPNIQQITEVVNWIEPPHSQENKLKERRLTTENEDSSLILEGKTTMAIYENIISESSVRIKPNSIVSWLISSVKVGSCVNDNVGETLNEFRLISTNEEKSFSLLSEAAESVAKEDIGILAVLDIGGKSISLSAKPIYSKDLLFIYQNDDHTKYVKVSPTNPKDFLEVFEKLLKSKIVKFNTENVNNDNNEDKPKSKISPPSELGHLFHQFEKETCALDFLVSLFGIEDTSKTIVKTGVFHKKTMESKVALFVLVGHHPKYPDGLFIKITHQVIEENFSMQFMRSISQNTKNECTNVAQIHAYHIPYRNEENEKLFFAVYSIIKKNLGQEVCEKLGMDDFSTGYASMFFYKWFPLQITVSELLIPLNIQSLLNDISCNKNMLKLIVSIRWVGQCLEILSQLHFKIGMLHSDISFDNIMLKKHPNSKTDGLRDDILKNVKLRNSSNTKLAYDLVITDLNNSMKLCNPQDETNLYEKETLRSIYKPCVSKFPYTHDAYEFYNMVQSDNYAMAILIAKLVRRLMFEDFGQFFETNDRSISSFQKYGECVITYFRGKLQDEKVDPIFLKFLNGLIELLSHIILQSNENPSRYSSCIEIYRSKISNSSSF